VEFYKADRPPTACVAVQTDDWGLSQSADTTSGQFDPTNVVAMVHETAAEAVLNASPAAMTDELVWKMGFIYDPKSGYYFEAQSGYYYDSGSQLFYHPRSQQYYDFQEHKYFIYDPQKGQRQRGGAFHSSAAALYGSMFARGKYRRLAAEYKLPVDGSVEPAAFEVLMDLCEKVQKICKLDRSSSRGCHNNDKRRSGSKKSKNRKPKLKGSKKSQPPQAQYYNSFEECVEIWGDSSNSVKEDGEVTTSGSNTDVEDNDDRQEALFEEEIYSKKKKKKQSRNILLAFV